MKIPFIASTVILSACLAVHAEPNESDRPHGHRVDPVRRDVNRYLDLRDMTKDDRLLDHSLKQKTNSVAQWKKWKSERQAELGALRKKLSLPPAKPDPTFAARIERLEKIRTAIALLLEQHILLEHLREIDRQRIKLPFFSPTGLRQTRDLNEALELLGSAKQLKVHGDMIPGKWNEDHSEYTPYLTVPLDVDSPETIRKLVDLLRSSGFTFDARMTQDWKDGVKIGTAQHFMIEVEGKAYIYILADMLMCQDHKTYTSQKYEDDEDTYLMEQIALVLKEFADEKKERMPNQRIQPTK